MAGARGTSTKYYNPATSVRLDGLVVKRLQWYGISAVLEALSSILTRARTSTHTRSNTKDRLKNLALLDVRTNI